MKYIIMDIETDGLLDKVTKIYCLCYAEVENNKVKIGYLTGNDSIRDYIKANKDNTFIGHNVCKYDNLVLQKLLGYRKGEIVFSGRGYQLTTLNRYSKH